VALVKKNQIMRSCWIMRRCIDVIGKEEKRCLCFTALYYPHAYIITGSHTSSWTSLDTRSPIAGRGIGWVGCLCAAHIADQACWEERGADGALS
jgi:hypothetical protein